MAWSESEFEESMPNTRTQTNMHLSLISCNLLAQMYICTAELATWGVSPDVNCSMDLVLSCVNFTLSLLEGFSCILYHPQECFTEKHCSVRNSLNPKKKYIFE